MHYHTLPHYITKFYKNYTFMGYANITIHTRHTYTKIQTKYLTSPTSLYFSNNQHVTPSHQTQYQWYRINSIEITDNHKIALCNDLTIQMVPLLSVEPSEVNAVETIARLKLSQTYKDYPNNTHTQSIYSNSILTNIKYSPQNNTVHPHNQSTLV